MKFDVKHIAKLANLPLAEKEIAKFEKQLSAILDYIKDLEKVNTSKVSPTNNITGLENITKPDIASPSLTQDQALSNAKKKHNGFFEVDAILNHE